MNKTVVCEFMTIHYRALTVTLKTKPVSKLGW